MPKRLMALIPLALAACSPDAGETADAPPSEPVETPSAAADEAPTVGGDGSPIMLSPLDSADLASVTLEGELGCSFTYGGDTLLVAKGFVADAEGHAQGVAKIGDYVERIGATEPGGFDVLPDGAHFAGKGMAYTVSRTASEPLAVEGSGESPPYPAALLLQRGDGAERRIAGTWRCGP